MYLTKNQKKKRLQYKDSYINHYLNTTFSKFFPKNILDNIFSNNTDNNPYFNIPKLLCFLEHFDEICYQELIIPGMLFRKVNTRMMTSKDLTIKLSRKFSFRRIRWRLSNSDISFRSLLENYSGPVTSRRDIFEKNPSERLPGRSDLRCRQSEVDEGHN